MRPTLHILSLPHTQTTREFDVCAYTAKVRKFCTMMSVDWPVILYAGDENEAECLELVTCVTRNEQREWGMGSPYYHVTDGKLFDWDRPHWQLFNSRLMAELTERVKPGDLILTAAGVCHQTLMEGFPEATPLEFGIGYSGSWAPFRVFESYAWMHGAYAYQQGHGSDYGRFYDTVIPNFFEAAEFPEGDGSGDYLLYVGRLIKGKGLDAIYDLFNATNLPLYVAGPGDVNLIPPGARYFGTVGPEKRAALYGGARATLVPTAYVEPFGGVHAESLLCGTPVITTDWGVFTETVEQGVDGWRCRTLGEFMWAAEHAPDLNRLEIRKRALDRFSTEAVKPRFDHYLERLIELDWTNPTPQEPLL